MKNRKFQQTISVLALLAVFFASSVLVKALPGDPDETYGATGFYIDNLPNTGNQESTVFLDGEITADGKLTSVGVFSYFVPNFGTAQDFYVQRILPNGVRDPSFGNGTGSVRFANVFPPASQAVARAVRIQQDNKIVIAGVCNIVTGFGTPNTLQSGFGMCAARLLPSGALDTSFGGNNFIVQHSSNQNSWFSYTMPAGTTFLHYPGQVESGYAGAFATVNAAALDVAIHSDGRIVLAGYSPTRDFNAQGNFLGYNFYATLATLTPNGSLSSAVKLADQTFEQARRANIRAFTKVEAQSDGNVVAVGFNSFMDPQTFFVTAGRWLVSNGSTMWHSENLNSSAQAQSVKFTRGNKILVSGSDLFQSGGSMRRFNSNLTLDTTFGINGKILYCRPGFGCTPDDNKYAVENIATLRIESIQNDGKILALAGNFEPFRFPLGALAGDRLVRFNPDGSVDRSFGDAWGTNPNIITNYGYYFLNRRPGGSVVQRIENAGFAVLQADGKILSGGAYIPTGGQPDRAGVTRRQNTFRNGIYSDFGNDGRADLSVYRPTGGVWHSLDSFNGSYTPVQFGISTDKIAPADFDGDGKTDRAVFRDGVWYVFRSSDNQVTIFQWGSAGDLPRPGDFNGDGFADFAVFRPSNGVWYIYYSNPIQPGNITYRIVQFGQTGDIPLLADFDADGKSDVSVFRNGVWYFIRSGDGSIGIVQFGIAGDVPVPDDYDADSKADLAVFRNGVWYVLRSTDGGATIANWGASGDRAVPGDYDNDGRSDFAIYRSGVWWILRSSDNGFSAVNFGLAADKPIPAAYQSSN